MTASQTADSAGILIIGNEILSGRTRDANLQFLAGRLGEVGLAVKEARVIPDEEEAIIAAVNALRARHTYVFTTGGIGPTHDDITAASVAKAFGRKLIRHPEAVRLLEAYYPPEKRNPARMRMSEVPEGAALIANPVSFAPGFQVENVFVLAGVPFIVEAMWDDIRPRLTPGRPWAARSLTCALAEGDLSQGLRELQGRYADLSIGSYPFLRRNQFGVTIVLRGQDTERLAAAAAELAALMRGLGGEPVETAGTPESPEVETRAKGSAGAGAGEEGR